MSEQTNITANLVAFYTEIAGNAGLHRGTIAGIPYVDHGAGRWPSYLLDGGVNGQDQVIGIVSAMQKKSVPSLWIMESYNDPETEKLLSLHGLRKINYWTGMSLEKHDAFEYHPDRRHVQLKRLGTLDELSQWIGLVNEVVMTSAKLEMDLFSNLLSNDGFHFFGLWKEKDIIATTLIFVHKNTGGIYFVATRKEFQGMGYGACLAKYALQEIQKQAINKFVLHSTKAGMRLYQKLGFTPRNRYDIYWMLGNR